LYVPQVADSFKIVVTVPVGEDTQEAQQLLQNDNHNDDHEDDEEEEAKKEEMYHDADEIKTFGNEAPIPTVRLRDLQNRIDITTPLEFRIKRVPCDTPSVTVVVTVLVQ
jgi:hypothetical protein